MNKLLTISIIMLLAGVLFLSSIIYISYSKVQYDKDGLAHMMSISNGGTVIAEYEGKTVQVLGMNISRLIRVVSVTERVRMLFAPSYEEINAVYLNFSDGAQYIIINNPEITDGVYVIYNYKSKHLYFKISGYKSWEWTMKAISPEGIYNENIVIE